MTKKEAVFFFELNDQEYPEEQWENVLFEYKQFFLTRPVVEKVYKAKLNKLQKQYQAYLVLTNSLEAQKELVINKQEWPVYAISQKVEQAFQALFTFRSAVKQLLLQTNNTHYLVELIQHWLQEEQRYQSLWLVNLPEEELKGITIAKEKDPMILLSAIKKWNKGENKDFKTLKQNLNDLPESLLDEVKRLSLLIKLNV